jgi:hypothetical protein
MGIEPSVISSFMIAATTLILFLYSQANNRARAARRRARVLERRDSLRARYIHRLELGYASLDRPLPEKPDGYEAAMEDEDL